MSNRAWLCFGLLLCVGAPTVWTAPSEPTASDVVVRGVTTLERAFRVALPTSPNRTDTPRPVRVIVDGTPHTQRAATDIADALAALDDVGASPWEVTALGERPKNRHVHPRDLRAEVTTAVAADTTAHGTVDGLSRSLRGFEKRGGVVIYLGDWRFEDDARLERLGKTLRGRGLRFVVIGSEAAFGRAWNDGLLDGFTGRGALDMDPASRVMEGIGRSPFAATDPDAPWHGGDTGWPRVAYRWDRNFWRTEFAPQDFDALRRRGPPGGRPGASARERFEELRDRLRRGNREAPLAEGASPFRRIPLPSAFGAYGLMRLCALTGGRYVLWSWNPQGRQTVEYDFSRCNLFQPSLGSRKSLKAHARGRSWDRACLRAWHLLAEADDDLLRHSPALAANFSTPQDMDWLPRSDAPLRTVWPDKAGWRAFLDRCEELQGTLDQAGAILRKACATTPGDRPGDRRAWADARLFEHIVHVARFEVGEMHAAARTLDPDAWEDPDTMPGLVSRTWIRPGRDPYAIQTTHDTPLDAEAGKAMEDARRDQLSRFRGTPFGEQVALNEVATWRVRRLPRLQGMPTTPPSVGRSPSESDGDRPTSPPMRPPGGGSSGGGPSTGR